MRPRSRCGHTAAPHTAVNLQRDRRLQPRARWGVNLWHVDENTRVSPLTAKIFMFYFSFCRRFTDSKTRLEAWENNLIRKTWVSKHNRTKTHRAIGQHLYIIQENQNQGSILDWSGNQMNYENDKILSAIALWCQQSKAVILLSVISEFSVS